MKTYLYCKLFSFSFNKILNLSFNFFFIKNDIWWMWFITYSINIYCFRHFKIWNIQLCKKSLRTQIQAHKIFSKRVKEAMNHFLAIPIKNFRGRTRNKNTENHWILLGSFLILLLTLWKFPLSLNSLLFKSGAFIPQNFFKEDISNVLPQTVCGMKQNMNY